MSREPKWENWEMKKVGHHYQIHKQKTKPEKLNKGGIGEWYWDAEANFDSLSISISLYFQIVNSGTNSNIKNPSPSMEIQSSKKTKTKIQPKKHQKGEKIYIHVYVILFLLLLWRQEKLNWDFDHNQERSHDRTKEERKTGISPLSFHLSRIAIVSPCRTLPSAPSQAERTFLWKNTFCVRNSSWKER